MADMHTPLAELKSERIAMMMTPTELDRIDSWRFENRIGSRAKAMRMLIASALAPSQDAETIKALKAQIATKDTALKVALAWSDSDWVGHEIVTAALAGSAS